MCFHVRLLRATASFGDIGREEVVEVMATAYVPATEYKAGKSRVFLRKYALESLQRFLETRKQAAATTIQSRIRRFLASKSYEGTRSAVVKVQAQIRGTLGRMKAKSLQQGKVNEKKLDAAERDVKVRGATPGGGPSDFGGADRLCCGGVSAIAHFCRSTWASSVKSSTPALRVACKTSPRLRNCWKPPTAKCPRAWKLCERSNSQRLR